MEIEHFKVTINDNETKVERDIVYKNWKDNLIYTTRTSKSKNTDGDTYNKKIGIVVAILKSLGFSRRIVGKISEILIEESKRKKW